VNEYTFTPWHYSHGSVFKAGSMDVDDKIAEISSDFRAERDARGNAIAALPDLVAALEKIVKYADSEPDGGDTVEMHRANIEHARLHCTA
jgi:hypothetical protein